MLPLARPAACRQDFRRRQLRGRVAIAVLGALAVDAVERGHRQDEPLTRTAVIPGGSGARRIKFGEAHLGARLTVLGRPPQPLHRLAAIAVDRIAVVVGRIDGVAVIVDPVVVHDAEIVFGIRIALGCGRDQALHRRLLAMSGRGGLGTDPEGGRGTDTRTDRAPVPALQCGRHRRLIRPLGRTKAPVTQNGRAKAPACGAVRRRPLFCPLLLFLLYPSLPSPSAARAGAPFSPPLPAALCRGPGGIRRPWSFPSSFPCRTRSAPGCARHPVPCFPSAISFRYSDQNRGDSTPIKRSTRGRNTPGS